MIWVIRVIRAIRRVHLVPGAHLRVRARVGGRVGVRARARVAYPVRILSVIT